MITWYEVPSLDMDRAVRFYGAILGKTIEITDVGGHPAGLLPSEGSVQGLIRCSPEFIRPGADGPNIYFAVQNIESAVASAQEFGGSVVVPPTPAGPLGQFAWVIDSEGNRIALNEPLRSV